MRFAKPKPGTPDHAKVNGVHYTPPELAGFLASVTAQALGKWRSTLHVLDPACGDGGLLSAIVRAVPARLRRRVFVSGYETDPAALHEAERGLSHSGAGGVSLQERDFLSVEGVESAETIGRRFDVVIANPPYVRTQVLGAKRSQVLAERFGLSGRVDLYQAFTQAMANVLKPGGVLGLLTSNRFLTVKSGACLRELLGREFALEAIYDLGDTRLFSAAVLPVIVVAKKQRSETSCSCLFDRVYEQRNQSAAGELPSTYSSILEAVQDRTCAGLVKTPNGTYSVERGVLCRTGQEAWTLSTPNVEAWLQKVSAHRQCAFANLAKIRVGIKTTADEVFLRDDWEHLPDDRRPERELLRPLLTHHEADRWFANLDRKRKQVLYPHRIQDGRRRSIDLEDYPRAGAYLKHHETRLRSRKYVIDSGRKWYEIWVPQNPDDWRKDKLVYPDISEFPRFFLDTTGAIVNGDCYWITLHEGVTSDWLLLMLAVANSSFITRYYDTVYHNKLYAGRRRFMTQYVGGFPLPALESPCSKKIVRLVSHLVRAGKVREGTEKKIDCLVWRAFGLEEKDVPP